MSFSRKFSLAHVLAAGVVGASLIGVGAASATPAATPESALARAQLGSMPGEAYSQYRRRGGYYGRGRGRGVGAGGIAAGVIGGLAAGALLGGALSGAQAAPAYGYGAPGPAYGYGPGQPVGNVYGADPEFVNYCASRYRSFDPASGTFLGNDGRRYPCQ